MSAVKNGWLSNHYLLGDEITFESIGSVQDNYYNNKRSVFNCLKG